ncbi:hypothetical protein [Aliiglaciecola litoralis]|uniref:Uncharacterized protein n=1 Tax=Aliiglaciecola litoralis TaxID=582857 RepID=A0ABP3WQZ3_9ALTE
MRKTGIFAVSLSFLLFSSASQGQENDEVWIDTMHKSISESVMDSAQWFDNFFAKANKQEDQHALGEVRLRLGWEPRSRELNEFEAKLKVRVKLPNLKNRVDLILSDYEDNPDDKVRAGRVNDINRQDNFSLALRYKNKPDSGLSHRLGFGRRFQYFAKSRYRDTANILPDLNLRYDASIYYYNRDGFGSDLGLGLDYDYSKEMLLRFENRFYFRDKSKDWLWQHSWQALQQINDRTAVVYGYYIEGLSRPNYRLEEYLLSVKFRRNTQREWLFYDIEPFILWRRDENFSASFGIALRIEGFFGER